MPRSAGLGLARVAADTPVVERGTLFDTCPGRAAIATELFRIHGEFDEFGLGWHVLICRCRLWAGEHEYLASRRLVNAAPLKLGRLTPPRSRSIVAPARRISMRRSRH